MKRSSLNFVPHTLKKLFLCVLCASFILPSSAPGVSKRALNYFLTLTGFVRLATTIARINHAMKIASENPLDQNRRDIVRQAVSAMPAALIGMAGEFRKGNLHNGDLQNVLSVFGSFVDVNAAANMTQFLKKPDPSLIPKVGTDFPKDILDQAKQSRHVVFNSKAPKPTQIGAMPTTTFPAPEQVDTAKGNAAKGNEIVDLSAVITEAAVSRDPASGEAVSRRVVFNRNADRNAPKEATNPGSTDSRIIEDASKDLTRIEGRSRVTSIVGSEEEKEDTLFKTTKKQTKKVARKKGKDRWRAIEKPKSRTKAWPNFRKSSSVFQILWDWVIPSAYGEKEKKEPPCEVGCPGGSGTEGSDKFGGLASMFSMLVGPLTAGIASMAQMQANKDSERAETERVRIQNQAAQERAELAAQVQQQSLAAGMLSTQAALQAQKENAQLMAQAKARSDEQATAIAREKNDLEKHKFDVTSRERHEINREQVALARDQFQEGVRSARRIEAAESARNYFAMNSQGPGLVTTRTGTTTTQVGSQTSTSATSPPLSDSTGVTGQTGSRTPAGVASDNTARTPVTSRASLALLDSLTQRPGSRAVKQVPRAVRKPFRKVPRFFAPARRFLENTEARVLRAIHAEMQVNRVARGSSRESRRPTDLGRAIIDYLPNDLAASDSFSEFRNTTSNDTDSGVVPPSRRTLYAPAYGQTRPGFGSSETTHRGGGN